MLSNASQYAIRAVLFLAEKSNKTTKFSAVEISDALEIPFHFIAKLLQLLVKKKVVSSTKGPNGGFFMTSKNTELKICDVLVVIETKKVFEGCFLGLSICGDENPCPVHHIVAKFKSELFAKFEQQSIKNFAKEIKENGTYISLKGIYP